MKQRWDKCLFLLVHVIVPVWNYTPRPFFSPVYPHNPLLTHTHPCGLLCHPRDSPNHPEGSEPDQSPQWLNSAGQIGSIGDRLLPPLVLSLITHTSLGLRSNMWPHRSVGWFQVVFSVWSDEAQYAFHSAFTAGSVLFLLPANVWCHIWQSFEPSVQRGRVTLVIRTQICPVTCTIQQDL